MVLVVTGLLTVLTPPAKPIYPGQARGAPATAVHTGRRPPGRRHHSPIQHSSARSDDSARAVCLLTPLMLMPMAEAVWDWDRSA